MRTACSCMGGCLVLIVFLQWKSLAFPFPVMPMEVQVKDVCLIFEYTWYQQTRPLNIVTFCFYFGLFWNRVLLFSHCIWVLELQVCSNIPGLKSTLILFPHYFPLFRKIRYSHVFFWGGSAVFHVCMHAYHMYAWCWWGPDQSPWNWSYIWLWA